MSNITIQPNGSGSGTFSIASPNSNTSRTLTLPDSTGVLLNDASSLASGKLTGALPAIDGSALTGVGASTTYGDVGTYVFGRRAGSASAQAVFTAGSTYAGSTLYPAGISGNVSAAALYWSTSVSTLYSGNTGSAALTGTWRAMGSTSVASGASENPVTLFVRTS